MAHAAACHTLPTYSCRFSRKDFTLPQLFACLVVKDLLKRSYRGAEAVLRDSQPWLDDIGMDHAPDHNTLCRAAKFLLKELKVNSLLDLTTRWADEAGMLQLDRHPLANERRQSIACLLLPRIVCGQSTEVADYCAHSFNRIGVMREIPVPAGHDKSAPAGLGVREPQNQFLNPGQDLVRMRHPTHCFGLVDGAAIQQSPDGEQKRQRQNEP